jgi:hypothetical protein
VDVALLTGPRRDRVGVRLAGATLVMVLPLALGGCFLTPASPRRPDARPVSGPTVSVEACQSCHAAPVGGAYARSLHAAAGIRCGQCHTPGGHPDFTQPVRDDKCGGCHQSQYQQTLASQHFATRVRRSLDADRVARVALRQQGFTADSTSGRHFVGDEAAGERGGRLCAACHYDEHRLGLGAAQRAHFCVGCHASRDDHYPIVTPDPANRCVTCHVRTGETVTGQVVNTHRFAWPGAEGSRR